MPNNDYGIRFTEDKYATKSDVSHDLKMSMVDPIWSIILKYRSSFNRYLGIKTIDRNPFILCSANSVSSSFSNLDSNLMRLLSEFMKLANDDASLYKKKCLSKCLQYLSRKNELDSTDSFIKDLVNGFGRGSSSSNEILQNYLFALETIKEKRFNNPDIDFLADIYSKLTNNDELTSFYRENNDSNNKTLIDRRYNEAPFNLIEPLMDSLFSFIKTSNFSASIKALISYYYINYVKPFPKYNDEMALLFAKAILAHDQLGEAAILLPLETFFVENVNELARMCNEVQKNNDLTYFLTFAVRVSTQKVQELLDDIANLNRDILKKDFYNTDENVQETKTEEVSLKEKIVAPVEEKPIVEVTPKVVKPAKPVEVIKPKEVVERIAVSYIPPAIDEKEAARLEIHLLECDPLLKKGEARFYARHCTLGKMYTIAQFKKYNGCAYETARVGMDQLAELGYYKKQQVKNKYVYTPIVRK